MPIRLALLAVLLAAATAALVASGSQRSPDALVADARAAEDRGDARRAVWLYRRAAGAGSLRAQVRLANEHLPLGTLADPHPTPAEASRWRARAHASASALADAGNPEGHAALGFLLATAPKPVPAESLALARRHLTRAARGGWPNATATLALLVLETDGPLAAEPYHRRALATPGVDADLRHAVRDNLRRTVLERPSLLSGRTSGHRLRDYDAVAEAVFLWTGALAGDAASAEAFDDRVRTLRQAAADGDAGADSVLLAVCAAQADCAR